MSVMETKLSATVQHPAVSQYTGGITTQYHFAVALNSVMVTDKICEPNTSPPVSVKVIDCLSRSNTFTSCLSYNASPEMGSTSATIQIGCSSVVNASTCSPEGEPSDAESVSLLVINCTGI